MKLWVLNVIDPNAPDWAASTYKGEVIVRAFDEKAARREATNRFFKATSKQSVGEEIKANPWSQQHLVSCEQYSGNEYLTEGENGVLSPSNT